MIAKNRTKPGQKRILGTSLPIKTSKGLEIFMQKGSTKTFENAHRMQPP